MLKIQCDKSAPSSGLIVQLSPQLNITKCLNRLFAVRFSRNKSNQCEVFNSSWASVQFPSISQRLLGDFGLWVRESGYHIQIVFRSPIYIRLPSEERTSCSICSKMSLLFDWVWQLLHWFSCGCYQQNGVLFIIYTCVHATLCFCEFKCHSTNKNQSIYDDNPRSWPSACVVYACVLKNIIYIYTNRKSVHSEIVITI